MNTHDISQHFEADGSPRIIASRTDGECCSVASGSAGACADCKTDLKPDRYFRWLRDSDRAPICDKCSANYDYL